MTTGTFHCSVCGAEFESDVIHGDYEVTCPNGHTLSYETPAGSEKSECTCPICTKIFEVDLISGTDDIEAVAGLLEFNSSENFINMWMVI